MGRLVIGLTGAFGSGCTFIAEHFFQDKLGYKVYSLSTILKEMFIEENHREHKNRKELQEYGNFVRNTAIDILAVKVCEKIELDALPVDTCIIIDSIRNPAEIEYLRKKFTDFFLIAVFADYEVRWNRVKKTYDQSKDRFDSDELKDQGNSEPHYGQKVSNCFFEADLILSNNLQINYSNPNAGYNEMLGKINNYINAFQKPTSSDPTIKESLMAMAYTVGRRSKCLKRKVGAIIVDKENNVLASGFNGVPRNLDDCKGKHGDCYRDIYRTNLLEVIKKDILDEVEGEAEVSQERVIQYEAAATEIVKKIKVLELCRSLHAEENTILSLVGNSIKQDLSDCTLYATTYPCNLCANKIVQAGIKSVVYFEPYPVIQAKEIFDEADVKSEPFEGVTFRAFFRAFNYEA